MKTPPPQQQKREVRRQEQHACESLQAVDPGSAPEPRPAPRQGELALREEEPAELKELQGPGVRYSGPHQPSATRAPALYRRCKF